MTAADRRIARITGRALVLMTDDVDTDRIIPARFLKAITFDGLEAHVFEDDRRAAAEAGSTHPFDDPARAGAAVLVAGANFGCGSSREHAPRAIRQRGIRAVVSESFAEIFAGNALAIGLPCVTLDRPALERVAVVVADDPAVEVVVDVERREVTCRDVTATAALPDTARSALLSGDWDATVLLLERYDEVEVVARRLPYLNDWRAG